MAKEKLEEVTEAQSKKLAPKSDCPLCKGTGFKEPVRGIRIKCGCQYK
jgi:hypothetical protein